MIPDRDPDALLARIDRLERRLAAVLRTLSVTAAVLLLVAGIAVLAGNRTVASAQGRGAAGEIVATSIKLVDGAGRLRAVLAVDGQVAGLTISDPSGRPRVLLNSDGELSKLAIVGTQQGFPRIVLAQQGDIQMLNLEDNAGFIGLTHSAVPTIVVRRGDSYAEVGLKERFAPRQPTPTIVPRLLLMQGERTLAELPAPAAR